jgi:hypothetical protein
MLVGTVVAGTGWGAAFSGSMRTVMAQAQAQERAALLSAFYVVGYLSFCLPIILTGSVVPLAGLQLAADVYGAVVILLALGSLLAMLWVKLGHSAMSAQCPVCPKADWLRFGGEPREKPGPLEAFDLWLARSVACMVGSCSRAQSCR